MNDEILIKNSVNNLKKGKSTKFLNTKELNMIIPFLNKEHIKYNVYYQFEDADKVIIYNDVLPSITCFKLETKGVFKHSDILGSIFSLSIEIENFGSIIISENNYYIIVLSSIANYVKYNLISIGKYNVALNEVDIKEIAHYKVQYVELTFTVSSERIDNVISHITNTSRSKVIDLIKDKSVILNYGILENNSYYLRNGDIFSIRKFGKFKYIGVINISKNKKFVIKVLKYN